MVKHPPSPALQTMGETFSLLARGGIINENLAERLRKSVGFRNIVVHNYEAVDWDIVFLICHQHLDDFRQLAVAFDKMLAKDPETGVDES